MNTKTEKHLPIMSFEHWDLYLHSSQIYLGWVYLLIRDETKTDFLDITEQEQREFFKLARTVKTALSSCFSPDKMNYAALGNVFPQLHVHLIPRYKTPRYLCGEEFRDERWGDNYAPYNKDFQVSATIKTEITTLICSKLVPPHKEGDRK